MFGIFNNTSGNSFINISFSKLISHTASLFWFCLIINQFLLTHKQVKFYFSHIILYFELRLQIKISATSFTADIGFYIKCFGYPQIELMRNPSQSLEGYSVLQSKLQYLSQHPVEIIIWLNFLPFLNRTFFLINKRVWMLSLS